MSGSSSASPDPRGDASILIGDDEDATEDLRPSDIRNLFRFIRPYLKPYRARVWGILALLFVQTAFNACFPLATQHLVDDGLIERNWDALVIVITFLGVAAVAVSVVTIFNDWLYSALSANVVKDIRVALFEHIQRLPIPYFQRTKSGDTLSRFSGDIVATEVLLVHMVASLIVPALEVVYSTALMFYFNAWLGLIGLAVFPMILAGPRIFSGRAFDLSYEKRTREARLLSAAQENILAQPVVKAFGLGPRAVSRYRKQNQRWHRYAFRMNFFASLAESTAHMGVYIIHIVILAIGAYWAYTDVITVGTLVAFEAMFVSMGYALTDLTQFVPTLAQAAGSVQHLQEVFDEPPGADDRPGARPLPRLEQAIAIDDVSFTFPDGREALDGVSFTVPKNSYLAIVGRSGSGKSTILNLLLRFYEPTSGRVTLDSVDILDGTQASLRDQIGLVSQDSFLFDTTVARNLQMGKADATQAEMIEALKAAEVWETVEALPQGLETIVGERGGRLSGGQRQRISIARALIRNPAILVLDEATSALDAIAESAVNATLQRIARNHTVINVTHRLSNVMSADQIIVLQDGRIVESGRHDDLLRTSGYYDLLWRTQQNDGTPRPAKIAPDPVGVS